MAKQSESSQITPKVFISHKFDDSDVASKVAKRLQTISNELDIYLASDPTFEGPRMGKSINMSLKKALGDTSLVLLIFSTMGKEWSWCMWECGVATNPNDPTPTTVVTLSLREEAPKPYEDALMIKASDLDSVQTFVNQLCTDKELFPKLGKPLTGRTPNDNFIEEQAKNLHKELSEFTKSSEILEESRWGGFSISMDNETAEYMKSLDSAPSGEDLINLLEKLFVSNPISWGVKHFGYENITPGDGDSVADLRNRWKDTRGDGLKSTPWTEIIVNEIWRIITNRPTNMIWEPFKSVMQGTSDLWVYPIVHKYRKHSNGIIEFDLLVIQTLAPKNDRRRQQ